MKLLTCPKCKSTNICEIVYGYPVDEEEYLKLVGEKKIYPGGCCIDSNSPSWYCNDCEHMWGSQDSEDIDSFDYNQGFNLNKVYD